MPRRNKRVFVYFSENDNGYFEVITSEFKYFSNNLNKCVEKIEKYLEKVMREMKL